MKAAILAGGFGTRLRPLTINLCKPMAPMANRPMLEHVVRLCSKHHFQEMLFMLHYSPDMIRRFFESGKNWDTEINYVRPELDLGTAGCLKFASDQPEQKPFFKDPFLVISGDVLTDIDLEKAWAFHKEKEAAVTLVLSRTKNPLHYGVVITDESGRVSRFLEKPSWGEVFSDTINTGIYILNPDVLKHVPEGQAFDFSKNLFPKLLEMGMPIYGYVADGYWKDIGDLLEYRQAHMDILENKVSVKPFGEPNESFSNVRVGENCEIEPGVKFVGNVVLGKNCRIAQGVEINQSVLGDNVRVGSGASIRKSVIWDRSFIGPEAALREAVVGRSVRVGQRARIEVGAIVGNRCEIGSDSILKPSVKMWPEKSLEDGAVLSSSLVWGERWNKQLFGDVGITGLANIEITPEFAAKLGSAYGAFLGPGTYVITSRDAHKTSRMVKRALISGLLSSGVRVGDLRMLPIPVMRYEMGKEGESGGVHVRLSPFDSRQVDIRVFDTNGNDLPVIKEKAVEQLFMREDFKRPSVQDVGEISVPPRAHEYYSTGFMKSVNVGAIQARKFKVVIDYSNSAGSQILPDLLGKLGIESVALNAFTSSNRVTRNDTEFKKSLSELSDIVTTLKADIGILMDNGAEKLFLIDEKGHVISSEEALVLVGELVLQSGQQDVIAYPVKGSSVLENIAVQKGVTVLRTPVNPRHLLEFARRPNVGFVGDADGGFIFPQFHPSFDAMFATARILEMMAQQDTSLGKLREQLAKPVKVLHRRVPCGWGQKGKVMRLAQDTAQGRKIELVDGVKIHQQNGWVLVLPDGNEAYCHLWAEAETEDQARAHLDNYTKKVEEWQKVPDEQDQKNKTEKVIRGGS